MSRDYGIKITSGAGAILLAEEALRKGTLETAYSKSFNDSRSGLTCRSCFSPATRKIPKDFWKSSARASECDDCRATDSYYDARQRGARRASSQRQTISNAGFVKSTGGIGSSEGFVSGDAFARTSHAAQFNARLDSNCFAMKIARSRLMLNTRLTLSNATPERRPK